jgi:hypothetical protein
MKTFSKFVQNLNEHCTTADVNQGNGVCLGVTNHLTPVENIVTNVRNLFASVLSVVASVGEDGFSVKLNSSKFVDKKSVEEVIYAPVYQSQSLYTYISAQGLDNLKIVDLGQYMVVYFGPKDIKAATTGEEPKQCCVPCKEMLEMNINEAEIVTIFESDDDEELEEVAKANLRAVITSSDKVKAAKQLSALVNGTIKLSDDYYFAGVKSKDGDESIALRWKYIKRRPHGKSIEITHSLMNIYGDGPEAIWVGDFDKDAKFILPKSVKELIESLLELLGAKETSDPCVYKITDDIVSGDDDNNGDKKDDSDEKNNSEENSTENNTGSEEPKKDDSKSDSGDLL